MIRSRTRAFTLVEMVVAFAILAILGAVGLGAVTAYQHRAADETSRATLDRVVAAQRIFSTGFGGYATEPGDLRGLEGVKLVTSPNLSKAPDVVSIAVGSDGTLAMATSSGSGKCLLRTVQALGEGSRQQDREARDAEACSASSVMPAGESVQPVRSVR